MFSRFEEVFLFFSLKIGGFEVELVVGEFWLGFFFLILLKRWRLESFSTDIWSYKIF